MEVVAGMVRTGTMYDLDETWKEMSQHDGEMSDILMDTLKNMTTTGHPWNYTIVRNELRKRNWTDEQIDTELEIYMTEFRDLLQDTMR